MIFCTWSSQSSVYCLKVLELLVLVNRTKNNIRYSLHLQQIVSNNIPMGMLENCLNLSKKYSSDCFRGPVNDLLWSKALQGHFLAASHFCGLI